MKFNCEQKAVVVVKHQQVLPTLRFSHEFGIVFLWSCGFFEDLLGPWFWACFFAEFCFVDFFQNLQHFCCFNVLQKAIWTYFCVNLLILSLFFRFRLPAFVLLAAVFIVFFNFPTKRILDIFFRLNYLIWLVCQICLLNFAK